MPTREQIEAAFADLVKRCSCPSCDKQFTDGAYQWGEAWYEGRSDLLRESGHTERDGPFKVKCESCGQRALIEYFAGRAVADKGAT